MVAALENQYDAFVSAQENRSLLARDEDLPSGEELGAEFERFLAQHAEDNAVGGDNDNTAAGDGDNDNTAAGDGDNDDTAD